ncbi:hypothetical protein MP638_007533 [Amoeboaphelidium occidentale]|nr:hypothetical protein MP638_007533 [Amoeboaphelidium occidentale]
MDPILWSQEYDQLNESTINIFPNDFYLKKNDKTPTGYILNLPENGGINSRAQKIDISRMNEFDGFPANAFMFLAGFPGVAMDYAYLGTKHPRDVKANRSVYDADSTTKANVYLNGFASHITLSRSLEDSSPSVIIDTVTGERVAHFIEEDRSGDANLLKPAYPTDYETMEGYADKNQRPRRNPQIILIRPEKRFVSGRRYIVAFKNLKSPAGDVIEAPLGFKIIRDNLKTNNEKLLKRRLHFQQNQIFETILRSGYVLDSKEIVIAWDFTTASLASATEHLRFMRDDAEEQIRKNNFKYAVKSYVDNYSEYIYRKVEGTFSVPLYIESFYPKMQNYLKRDRNNSDYLESRRPKSGGEWVEVPFKLFIPRSLVKVTDKGLVGTGDGSMMSYGHGLFDSTDELYQKFLHKIAFEQKVVLFGTEWIGLASNDLANLFGIFMFDIKHLASIPERASQGVLNQLMLMNVMRYGDAFQDPKLFNVGGNSVVEMEYYAPSHANELVSFIKFQRVKHVGYFGISLGGILGTVYSAMSKETVVSTLGVPGAPFSLLFQRTTITYVLFNYLLRKHVKGPSDRLRLLALIQNSWQLCDPGTYTEILAEGGYLSHNGSIAFPDEGKKRLLIQWSPNDALVSSVATLYLLRSIKAYSYRDDPYEIYYRDLDGFCLYSTNKRDQSGSIDSITRLQILRDNDTYPVLHVASAFHYKKVFWASPFHNVPFTLHDAVVENTHDFARLDFQAQEQMGHFLDAAKQSKSGKQVEGVWTPKACPDGCWDRDIPDKQNWMSKESGSFLKRFMNMKFLSQ